MRSILKDVRAWWKRPVVIATLRFRPFDGLDPETVAYKACQIEAIRRTGNCDISRIDEGGYWRSAISKAIREAVRESSTGERS